MSSGSSSVVIGPRLTRSNYQTWSIKMKAFLGGSELADTLEVEYEEPENLEGASVSVRKAAREAKAREQKALSIIQMSVDDTIFIKIAKCTTAKQAWVALAKVFHGVDRVKKVRLQSLRAEFELLKMQRGERVFDYIASVTDVVNQMSSNGEDYDDGRVVEKVLRSLDERFDGLVMAIEEGVGVDELTLDELVGKLQVYEEKVKKRDDDGNLEGALATKLKIDERRDVDSDDAGDCMNVERKFENRGDSRKFDRRFTPRGSETFRGSYGLGGMRGGRGRQNRDVECFRCHRRGHYARDCNFGDNRRNYGSRYDDRRGDRGVGHYVVHDNEYDGSEDDEMVLSAWSTAEVCDDAHWFMDSGASNHMCGNKKLFVNVDECKVKKVWFGDGSEKYVEGKGKVVVKGRNGSQTTIENVFYVPGLKVNLLSLGQLLEKGYSVSMNNGELVLRNQFGRVVRGVRMNSKRVFVMNVLSEDGNCLRARGEGKHYGCGKDVRRFDGDYGRRPSGNYANSRGHDYRSKWNVVCYCCHKKGHYARECRRGSRRDFGKSASGTRFPNYSRDARGQSNEWRVRGNEEERCGIAKEEKNVNDENSFDVKRVSAREVKPIFGVSKEESKKNVSKVVPNVKNDVSNRNPFEKKAEVESVSLAKKEEVKIEEKSVKAKNVVRKAKVDEAAKVATLFEKEIML